MHTSVSTHHTQSPVNSTHCTVTTLVNNCVKYNCSEMRLNRNDMVQVKILTQTEQEAKLSLRQLTVLPHSRLSSN